ncbi:MAG: ABC transporter ATP-binding protein [Herpetosiphonaceae bacterium]|nr:ABC transporter ATP-binding protein [Herpetosiphonaceae bacterium]
MGFILDGLDAEGYDRNYSDATLVRRISAYFRPNGRRILVVAGMIVLASLMDTAVPVLISKGIDALKGDPRLALLLGLAVTVGVLSCLSWAFNYIRQRLSAAAVADVVLALREDAFQAVTKRDLSFYDEFPSGKIVSRVTSDTQDFSSVVTLVMDLLGQVLLVVLILGYLFSINVGLTMLTLIMVPLVAGTALGFRTIARRMIRRSRRAQANVNSRVQESISGIAVAKGFRQEGAIYEDFKGTNRQSYHSSLRAGWTFSSIFPILDIVSGIGLAIVVYFGGLRALHGAVTAGEWYLFVQGLAIFVFPLTSISSFWSQFQQGLSASERVFALIDAEPKVVQTADEPVTDIRGQIDFEHLRFAYKPESVVLPDFSLHIPAGETLAVVGHTGAGKSSLARLIARFYEFQGGRLLIDGRDIRTLDLASYRRHIGIVPQSPFLFSGTVAENIRYGRRDATEEELNRVAHQIGGGEWVDLLEYGLNTPVGERGGQLSMGQRQLVALSRVLLHDPSILILDEATASVDPFTEAQIQDGLDLVMVGRTSIVIAHRLSTVKRADRIIVLKDGQIIESGTHAGLLRQGGHYAELYNTYFRHQSADYNPEAVPA